MTETDSSSAESRPPRIALISLGCSKNTVDAEHMLGELAEAGFELVPDSADPDLILVNTCGFIDSAREESRAVLQECIDRKDDEAYPRVVAVGCLSQRDGDRLLADLPGLDGTWGLAAHGQLASFCLKILTGAEKPKFRAKRGKNDPLPEGPRLLTTPKSYAYLRLSDGCDNRCSYCAIPQIRGALKSRAPETVLAEAEALVSGGVRELVLLAQDTTGYGKDLGGQTSLAQLLPDLLERTGDAWIRLLYAHPAHLDDAVIDLLGSEPRLCGYVDIPIQHASDRILKAMRRLYTAADVEALVGKLRNSLPDIVLRTSVLLGFPGETDEDFETLLQFVQKGYFQHLGAFVYSEEKGTAARHFEDVVPQGLAQERHDRLMQAQQETTFAWLDGRIGQTATVLVDAPVGPDTWAARTQAEAPDVDGIILLKGTNFYSGEMFPACLTSRSEYDILAKRI